MDEAKMTRLIQYIQQLSEDSWSGKIKVIFNQGGIKDVERKETVEI